MYREPATLPACIAATGWRKSKRCVEQGACVEVLFQDPIVAMRSSTIPVDVLLFTPSGWRAFLTELKSGSFDSPTPRP